MKIIKNKIYCVTGGGGFMGSHLVERIISEGAFVRTIGINLDELLILKNKYGDKIEIIQGDIKDIISVRQLITSGVLGVFHLAGFKYVGLSEKQTKQCISANVIGTMNVLDVSVEQNVEFVLGVSTAAAVQISSVYGATKMLMERLFNQYQTENSNIKFRTIRFDNILYSTGSVTSKWKNLIMNGQDITVTDLEATRFFSDINETIDLIFECLDSDSSKPFIPNIKSMSIGNLLLAMITKYSPKESNINIIKIGLQKGENKHEKMSENGPYSNEIEQYNIEEIIKKI
jgi:UDP-N-acetylglucosamine 4,6-dehydratase/UDP-glucose 4-epimerase